MPKMVWPKIKTKQDPEIYYRYGQMLKSNGKYAESNEQMKTFAALKPNDKRAQEFNENPNYLAGLMMYKERFYNKQNISQFGKV
jgi:hypothetical protein